MLSKSLNGQEQLRSQAEKTTSGNFYRNHFLVKAPNLGDCPDNGSTTTLQHFQIFPAYGIGPDLYLQYVKDLTGGHLCNGYTDFSKLEMHDCKIAVVHM